VNARERFVATTKFEKVDRPLLWEFGYWPDSIRRWYREGLPEQKGIPKEEDDTVFGEGLFSDEEDEECTRDVDVHNYFGLDKGLVKVPINSWMFPFEEKILQEDDINKIIIDKMGVKKRVRKDGSTVPQFLEWPVKDRDNFERIKERFEPKVEERLPKNWSKIVEKYKNRDFPLAIGGWWSGFFGSLRYLMGTENLCSGYYDKPRLIKYIANFLADFWINIWSEPLSQVDVDCAILWEDMCYNKGSLVSPAIFREFMMPYYKKLTRFLTDNGVEVIIVDSDGNVTELLPLFLESVVTGMYPFEVQAGMDITKVRKQYPNMQIFGGLDKTKLALDKEAIDRELETKLPFMFEKGGYVAYADHLIPPDVSWGNFKYYRERLKEIVEGFSVTHF